MIVIILCNRNIRSFVILKLFEKKKYKDFCKSNLINLKLRLHLLSLSDNGFGFLFIDIHIIYAHTGCHKKTRSLRIFKDILDDI